MVRCAHTIMRIGSLTTIERKPPRGGGRDRESHRTERRGTDLLHIEDSAPVGPPGPVAGSPMGWADARTGKEIDGPSPAYSPL